jgi:Flp pilus assembly protein TadD
MKTLHIWHVRLVPALVMTCLIAVACGQPTDSDSPAREEASMDPPPELIEPLTFESARDAAFALEHSGGDDEAVREAFLVVHAMKPEAYGVNVRLGQVCVRLGLLEESVAAFAQARAVRPDDVETLRALGTQLVEIGELERARAILQDLATHPEQVGAILLLESRMLGKSDQGEQDVQADALLGRALALPPEEAVEALMVLGRWMLEQGLFSEARRAFLVVLTVQPEDTGALKGLAIACWRMGLDAEAERWQEALELMLGLHDNVFTREQKTESGAANQRSAIERSEYIRGEIEAHGGRLARLTEIHPAWGDGFLNLAQLQAESGEPTKACATLEAYLQYHGVELSSAEREALMNRYCR